MKRLIIFLLVLAIQIPATCMSAKKELVGESYIRIPEQLKKGTLSSLKSYVSEIVEDKYVSYKRLYTPPIEGLESSSYLIVSKEKALPILAGGVSSYAGNEEGLVAALYSGKIKIWSDFECSELQMPDKKGASKIGYKSGSPMIVAADSTGKSIYVFDLNKCSMKAGSLPVKYGPAKELAVSSLGTTVSLIDDFNRLLCGPITGPLREVQILEGTPLLLDYTPAQGIVVVVEGSGKITMQPLKEGAKAKIYEVKGGPFISAAIHNYTICMKNYVGEETFFDLKDLKIVDRETACKYSPSWIYLEDGALIYATGVDRYKLSEKMSHPLFIVAYNKKNQIIRVRDVDSKTRFYSLLSGKQIPEVAAKKWIILNHENGVYKADKISFKLFDAVNRVGYESLYSRFVDGKFYLWWQEGTVSEYMNPDGLKLPERKNILSKEPKKWQNLVEGEIR